MASIQTFPISDTAPKPDAKVVTDKSKRSDTWMGMVMVVSIFGMYAILSISTLSVIASVSPEKCRLRYTYRQMFMDNYVGNPLYVSTNVVREPPRSRHEVLEGQAPVYSHMMYEVTVLPILQGNSSRDSAYMPVFMQAPDSMRTRVEFYNNPKANLLLQLAERGHISGSEGAILDALNISANDPPGTREHLQKFIQGAESAEVVIDRVEAFYNLYEKPGTYIVEQPSNSPQTAPEVLFQGYHHLSVSQPKDGVSSLVGEKILRQVRRTGDPGLYVNLLRCTGGHDVTSDKATDVKDFWELLSENRNFSHRATMCALNGQPSMVDITSDPRTSLSLFSTNDGVFLINAVVWISASFFLTRVIEKMSLSWMTQVLSVVLLLWQVAFIILNIVFFYVSDWVPINNVGISFALGAGSLFLQIPVIVAGLSSPQNEDVSSVDTVPLLPQGNGQVDGKQQCNQGGGFMSLGLRANPQCSMRNPRLHTRGGYDPKQQWGYANGKRWVFTGDEEGLEEEGQPGVPDEESSNLANKVGSDVKPSETKSQFSRWYWFEKALTWPLIYVVFVCANSPYVSTGHVQMLFGLSLVLVLTYAGLCDMINYTPSRKVDTMESRIISIGISTATCFCIIITIWIILPTNTELGTRYGYKDHNHEAGVVSTMFFCPLAVFDHSFIFPVPLSCPLCP